MHANGVMSAMWSHPQSFHMCTCHMVLVMMAAKMGLTLSKYGVEKCIFRGWSVGQQIMNALLWDLIDDGDRMAQLFKATCEGQKIMPACFMGGMTFAILLRKDA